jgi:hypothetical protein
MTNESVSKSQLLPYYTALSNFYKLYFRKTFFLKLSPKAANRIVISLFIAQDSAPHVATGLISVL